MRAYASLLSRSNLSSALCSRLTIRFHSSRSRRRPAMELERRARKAVEAMEARRKPLSSSCSRSFSRYTPSSSAVCFWLRLCQ